MLLALLLALTGDPKPIESLPPLSTALVSAISLDQSRLAVETREDGVLIIDMAAGVLWSRIYPSEAATVAIAWSADGTRIALLRDDDVVVIAEAASGRVMQKLPSRAPRRRVDGDSAIGFGSDGVALLRGAGAFGMQVWDIPTAKFVAQVPASQKEWITAVAIQRDGSAFALGDSSGRVTVWRSAGGERLRDLAPFGRPHTSFDITSLDFNASGNLLAVGNGSPCVRVLDWGGSADVRELHHPEQVFLGKGQQIGCVRFSRDGSRLLSMAFPDFEARVWDVATGEGVLALDYVDGHSTPIEGWISHDGSFVSMFSAWPGTRVGAEDLRPPWLTRPRDPVPAFQGDGDYAWAVVDHHLVVRKIPDGQPILRAKVRER